jgi:CubicO group peptidase (beta-lactamase class C family)
LHDDQPDRHPLPCWLRVRPRFSTVEKLGADGLASVGTFDWGGAYGSSYKVDPAERLVIVFMINQLPNSTDIAAKFPTLVYQALVAPRASVDRAQR